MARTGKVKKRKRKKKKVIKDKSPSTFEGYLISNDFDDVGQTDPIRLPTSRKEYYSIEIEDL